MLKKGKIENVQSINVKSEEDEEKQKASMLYYCDKPLSKFKYTKMGNLDFFETKEFIANFHYQVD